MKAAGIVEGIVSATMSQALVQTPVRVNAK